MRLQTTFTYLLATALLKMLMVPISAQESAIPASSRNRSGRPHARKSIHRKPSSQKTSPSPIIPPIPETDSSPLVNPDGEDELTKPTPAKSDPERIAKTHIAKKQKAASRVKPAQKKKRLTPRKHTRQGKSRR